MTPNPIQRLARWLFGSPEMSDPKAAAAERRCEAGHWMDPSWGKCPYCEAEKNGRTRTPSSKTRVDHPPDDPERLAGGNAAGERGRRITGVLVTFSWRREGQLFPLYEGKNLIGSGRAGDRRCDVLISTDQTLSREHALIRCLAGGYEIFDQKSENGTYMNDERVPVHGMPLEDGALVKTGATVWRFQVIRVPGAAAPSAPEKRAREARHEESEIVQEDSETAGPRRPTSIGTEEISIDRGETAELERDEMPDATNEEASRRHKHKTVVLGTADPPPPSKDRPTRIL